MDIFQKKPRKFKIGKLIMTDAVVNAMEDQHFYAFVQASFIRYCVNDWGDLERAGQKLNRRNLKHGGNLGGRYIDETTNQEIWILTTDSRDRTIVCMDYEGSKNPFVERPEEEE